MKIEIRRVSPYQNAKVFAVLMAIWALLFAIPMFFVFLHIPASVDQQGHPVMPPPAWLALLFPVVYVLIGYVMTVLGCWIYNFVVRFIGGIEFDTSQ